MATDKKTAYQEMADVIAQRVGKGSEPIVRGWQQMLTNLLARIHPQLRAGSIVTFLTISSDERSFFEMLHHNIAVPPEARAVYLSPSIRHQMMCGPTQTPRQPHPGHDPHQSPDEGVLLAYRGEDFGVIVNALFARPPYSAAVDVYDNGRLLAGYVYESVEACVSQLTNVLRIHLQPPST